MSASPISCGERPLGSGTKAEALGTGTRSEAVLPDSQWRPSEPAEPCCCFLLGRPLSGPGLPRRPVLPLPQALVCRVVLQHRSPWAPCPPCSAGSGRGPWRPLLLLGICLCHMLLFLLLSASLIQEAPEPPDPAHHQGCLSIAVAGPSRCLLRTDFVSGTWCWGSVNQPCANSRSSELWANQPIFLSRGFLILLIAGVCGT